MVNTVLDYRNDGSLMYTKKVGEGIDRVDPMKTEDQN